MDRTGIDRAVVLGGSMAGLLAARVLADHCTEVRVLDRDDLTGVDGPRRGIPQARHIHALLPRGRQILEELFPGLTDELADAGAPVGDLLGNARLHLGGHRLARADGGLTTISLSRPFLEDRVRERVRRLPNVTLAEPCDVVGLTATPDRRRIRGVRILRRADDSAEEVLEADLVVDASGRGSRMPRWLAALGHDAPEEERIGLGLGYATRTYRLDPDVLDGDWGTLQGPTPDLPRGGALARLEGGRWMVTLFGFLGDHPPTDPEGFLGFARSLRFPDLHDALRTGEPLDDPAPFRFPAAVRRRYERLSGLPDGLLPVGDGVCSLDPIYGQGMTTAALAALVLDEHLRRTGRPDPRAFVDDLATALDPAWALASGGDLALPGVEGRRTMGTRILGRYVARLHAAAAHDPRLASAFARVMALVDPPEALLRPAVALRVLRPPRWAAPRADAHASDAGAAPAETAGTTREAAS